MAVAVVGTILGIAGKLLDKVIQDPAQKAEAKYKVLELAQKGELAELEAEVQLATAQLEVNKVEAASPSVFKGGWRPATGWVCVLGLFYQFLGQPLLTWGSNTWGYLPPPALDTADLLTILMGMLGLGAYRSYERINGAIPKGK